MAFLASLFDEISWVNLSLTFFARSSHVVGSPNIVKSLEQVTFQIFELLSHKEATVDYFVDLVNDLNTLVPSKARCERKARKVSCSH